MAQVVINQEAKTDSPSQQAVKSSKQLVYVTDSKGRKLGLRRLEFLEEFRIMEAVGPELAANQTYMGMLNPLLYLAEIDGDPVPIPRTKLQIDGHITRAGREGFIAVLEGITKHFASDHKDLENTIKNLAGTQDSEIVSGS
jgi:hypothetical protein